MVALACVERLHARGERLPFALEVYAFADEEGLRYRTALPRQQRRRRYLRPGCAHA